MAYSATLANLRGMVSDSDHKRILGLFSKIGLSMDHPDFTEKVLTEGTQAILKTRDGKLRAAMPSPLGSCVFLNDVTPEQMTEALHKHKELMKNYPREGAGLDAFVDASDTGYTKNAEPVEKKTNGTRNSSKVMNDDAVKDKSEGGLAKEIGLGNGIMDGDAGRVANAKSHAGGPEGVDGEKMNGHKA
jgi:3-dehydroquinate synthase